MNIRSQYLPWPAVGTSILSIHHPVVGIRLDGRYATSKNYKHIIMNLITLISLISMSYICILSLQRTTHRMLPEAAGGPVSASCSHCRLSQLTWGSYTSSVCPSVCHRQHRVYRTCVTLLSASAADCSWEELPVPQMHQLDCQDTQLSTSGKKTWDWSNFSETNLVSARLPAYMWCVCTGTFPGHLNRTE